MNIKDKEELLELLGNIQANCGDNRGRDGEYLSDQIGKVIAKCEEIKSENVPFASI